MSRKFEVRRYALNGKLLSRYRIRACNIVEACKLEGYCLSVECADVEKVSFSQTYDDGLPENLRQRVIVEESEGEFR